MSVSLFNYYKFIMYMFVCVCVCVCVFDFDCVRYYYYYYLLLLLCANVCMYSICGGQLIPEVLFTWKGLGLWPNTQSEDKNISEND